MLLAAGTLSACGAVANGPIIGVPPALHAPGGSTSSKDLLAGVQQALQAGLDQAGATAAGSDVPQLAAQVNALANDASLIAAERMDALKLLGAQATGSREAYVQKLISDVQSNPNLSGVSVGGQNVQQTLLAHLQQVQGQLQALAAKIAADSLVDVLRSDVTSVASTTRVYGLVSPVTHVAIAAGDALHTASTLDVQSRQLFNQISAGSGGDPNYSSELNLSGRLQSAVNVAAATAGTAIRQVESLQPGDPSANAVLASQRQAVAALVAPSGALTQAASYIGQIHYLLALRQH